MLAEIINWVLNGVLGMGVRQIGTVAILLVGGWYLYKARSAASVLSDAVGHLIFASVLLGLLLALGIVPTIDVGQAISIVSALIDWLLEIVPVILR